MTGGEGMVNHQQRSKQKKERQEGRKEGSLFRAESKLRAVERQRTYRSTPSPLFLQLLPFFGILVSL
jgi:hypothetical protein